MNTQRLVLRTCGPRGLSYGGFQWPLEEGAEVEAPDWNPEPVCGGGLHGLLHGRGNGRLLNWSDGAVWMVVEAVGQIVDLGDKVKFPAAIVRHVGDQDSATGYLGQYGHDHAVAGRSVTAGREGTAIAGYRGTAIAGYQGTATAGTRGTAIAGRYGTATVGGHGTATAGDGGTATAGWYGTATAGEGGTATAGKNGIATVGEDGIAAAGEGGEIRIRYYDYDHQRYRARVGYIGEDGLEPDTLYRLDANNEFIEATGDQ